jgi:hypothetical protein
MSNADLAYCLNEITDISISTGLGYRGKLRFMLHLLHSGLILLDFWNRHMAWRSFDAQDMPGA